MKRDILLIFMLLTSCSTHVWRPYKAVDDSFRNCKRITYQIKRYPKERKVRNNITEITFERNYSSNFDSTLIYWTVESKRPKLPLANKSYIKINGERFELKNGRINTSSQTSTNTSYSSLSINDTIQIDNALPNVSSETKYFDVFVTPLPKKVVEEFKNATDIELRTYFGYQPYTFRFSKKQVERLQQLSKE
ncbi:hypothetical protein [Tenuifilum thalassicum]|uniref:Lipoprotein n=1 Tax=Tenuifilum thalassicum TaxID=2590900 RepID=A0A7D3Y0B2_9BACT|nr:hypothetical protein [Tenuifilum thalassicum]QKG80353.1 hypothetical protein FHG85_08790 [Tenuifilum thalassicum]